VIACIVVILYGANLQLLVFSVHVHVHLYGMKVLLLYCVILGNEIRNTYIVRLINYCVSANYNVQNSLNCMQDEELVDYNPHTELFHTEELLL